MSKIDLSKAKIGDKFRTELGYIVIFTGLYKRGKKYKYMFDRVDDKYYGFLCDINGVPYYNKEMYTIVEQVFDKGDLLDNNISAEERGQAIVEMAKIEYEKAKELGVAIQNLPYIVEQLKEDNPELQHRQEVVELAEKLFTEKYLQEWYQHLVDNNTAKTDYVTYIFEWAEKFVNAKDKYLKEGKL